MRATLSLLALLAIWSPSAFAAEPTQRILVIGHAKDGHPHRTHEYLPAAELLARCLRQTKGVEAIVSQGWPADPAASEHLSAIALYVPNGANVLFDGPQRQRVKQLLSEGVGLSAIHWSTGAVGEEYGQLWLDQLGAWFHTDFGKLEHIKKPLKLVDPQSSVARGLRDFEMFDEYYYELRFAPGAKPLLQLDRDGKVETIAWTYVRPNGHEGRSFGCVAGHYHDNFGNELFRRMLVNGILWTAGVDVPAGGAPCAIDSQELEVPEPPKQ